MLRKYEKKLIKCAKCWESVLNAEKVCFMLKSIIKCAESWDRMRFKLLKYEKGSLLLKIMLLACNEKK